MSLRSGWINPYMFTTVVVGGGTATGGSKSTPTNIGGINYYIHTFTSGGNFVVSGGSITCDILVVGGGGSGGTRIGGGGGGGGVQFTSQAVGSGTYTVTVGIGGSAVSSMPGTLGNNGGDSQFGALTSSKGGGGGGAYINTSQVAGLAGGSGGGGGGSGGSGGNGGAVLSSQGNVGGIGGFLAGGGGGGAGLAGNSVASGGAGGLGFKDVYFNSAGTSSTIYYAGGGGGSVDSGIVPNGGNGGGGAGANQNNSASSGVPNTGGGGGGARNSGDVNNVQSGAGGSGIVIVRYATTDAVVAAISVQYPPAAGMTLDSTTLTGKSYGNGAYIASTNSLRSDGFNPYRAFDYVVGNSIEWASQANIPTGVYLQLQMPQPIVLTSYNLIQRIGSTGTFMPTGWNVQASTNGSTWITIDTRSGISSFSTQDSVTFTLSTTPSAYNYFRFLTVAGPNTIIILTEWQLFGY